MEDADEWEAFRLFLGVGGAMTLLRPCSGSVGAAHSNAVAMAGVGDGLPWHLHNAGWSHVLYGAKRWLFYPFKSYPPGAPPTHLPPCCNTQCMHACTCVLAHSYCAGMQAAGPTTCQQQSGCSVCTPHWQRMSCPRSAWCARGSSCTSLRGGSMPQRT